jgi:hypothetical protein
MEELLQILNDERGTNALSNVELYDKEKRISKGNTVKKVEVKPLFEDKDDYFDAPHPNLLRGPFSLLEIAPKGSGKTVLLQNLLMWYEKYFDNIFIFSPTLNLDDKWKKLIDKLRIPEENLFSYYNDGEVSMLMQKIKNANKNRSHKDKIRCLFIFDDIIEQLPRGSRVSALNKLAMNHRHYNISHIIISQSFKKVDTVVRMNTTGIILFNTDNSKEREKIVEELAGNFSQIEFMKMYLDAVSEKFSFLFINYDTRKVYKKFDEEVGDLNKPPEHIYKKIERQVKSGVYK